MPKKSETGGLEAPFGEHFGDFLASFLQVSFEVENGSLRYLRLVGYMASQGGVKEATELKFSSNC